MKLITIQSSKSDWLDSFVEEYVEKINYFQKFEVVNLKSSKKSRSDSEAKKSEECEMLLKAIHQGDYVILFDEKGKALESKPFSDKIARLQTMGVRRITFVIGGAFGVGPDLKQRAQETWKLSDLVLNHHVALAVSLEQIYRAFTIIKNKPYHNE